MLFSSRSHQVPFQWAAMVRFSIQGLRHVSTGCCDTLSASSSCRVIISSHNASLSSGRSLQERNLGVGLSLLCRHGTEQQEGRAQYWSPSNHHLPWTVPQAQ